MRDFFLKLFLFIRRVTSLSEPENVEDTFDEYEEVEFKKNGSLRRSKRSQRDSISKSGNKKDEKEVGCFLKYFK